VNTLVDELKDFVTCHRPHGELVAGEGGLTPNGYRLTVSCLCGVTFERWMARADQVIE